MPSTSSPITVVVVAEATRDAAVYFPPSFFVGSSLPERVVLCNAALPRKEALATTLSRAAPATDAGVGPTLMYALGGDVTKSLACEYRSASFRDRVRLTPGGPLALATIVVTGLAAIGAAIFALQQGVKDGTATWFLATIFALNWALAWLNLAQDLSKI